MTSRTKQALEAELQDDLLLKAELLREEKERGVAMEKPETKLFHEPIYDNYHDQSANTLYKASFGDGGEVVILRLSRVVPHGNFGSITQIENYCQITTGATSGSKVAVFAVHKDEHMQKKLLTELVAALNFVYGQNMAAKYENVLTAVN